MLLELAIQDFAIIDAVRIPFEPGLNAITGETGAGKSILIDALGAVLGGRVGSEVVRTGAPSARIEATFAATVINSLPALRTELMDIGVDPEDDVVILSREVTAAGRSSARINGRAVTVGVLNRIGSLLVDIHGQSDHLSLLRTAHHLDVLDRFGHTTDQRRAVADLVDEWQEITRQLREIDANARERAQRVDLLRFQLEEISAANIRSGEDDDLSRERSILANAERISSDISAAREALVGTERIGDAPGALDLTRTALRLLSDLIEMDPRLTEQRDRLGDAQALLEDVAAELRRHAEEVEFNPHRLQEVDDRLTEIRQLKRKYGTTTDEVIAFGAEVADALMRLEGGPGGADALRVREREIRSAISAQVVTLSRDRQIAGDRLKQEVETAIHDLNMGRAEFSVSLTQTEDAEGVPFGDGGGTVVRVDRTGADRVEFLLAPNAGDVLKPLARVVSGGETARLMLALKSILADADETPTLVFDEVDVGVGGRSGQVVGEKVWSLTTGGIPHQVIVISHLSQIAAFADTHFRIEKAEASGKTVSRVVRLEGDERIEELAAMLDGEPPSPASRANARELLHRVEGWKALRLRAEVR